MNAPAPATISHDAAAALLQVSPDQLTKLVGAGVVRRAGPGKYVPAHLIRDYIGHLHQEPDRRERAPTQAEIAAHLDMSERNLRELLGQLGMDHKQVPMSALRVAYIRRLREQAAGRMGGDDSEGLDLVQERAALARSQREGQDIKNSVARGTWGPIDLLGDVLANASQAVVDRFDQIPAALRRVVPDLPQPAFNAIMREISSARNEMVRKTESLMADMLGEGDLPVEDEDAPPVDLSDPEAPAGS